MMMALKKMGVAFVAVGAFTGCLKKELPVPVHESGNVATASVDMDPSYKYQLYFSLKTNTVVGKNLKTEWDLGFETAPDGYHVVLNGAKSMYAMATAKSDFLSVTMNDTVGFSAAKKCDSHTGSYDSTAVGDWRNGSKVYVVDKGFNELGQHLGYAKVQFLSVSNNGYSVRFSALNGAGDTTLPISKDTTYNLSFLSLADKKQLLVEPPKVDWDIAFTQYTYVFYDQNPPVPYLVTGCLLNRNKTKAYLDTVNAFADINYSSVAQEKLVSDLGVIGYGWKVFNGTSYTVLPRNSYVIQSAEGVLYKLHFTSFYNSNGIKGMPKWEYQRL